MHKCSISECDEDARYGDAIEQKMLYCHEHQRPDDIDLQKGRCQYAGCSTNARYGNVVERKKLYCGIHRRSDDVDLKGLRCYHDGCKKTPGYGAPDTTTPRYCKKHRLAGYIKLIGKSDRCVHESGCTIDAFFMAPGDDKVRYCKTHAPAESVFVAKQKCIDEDCKKQALYGLPGTTARIYCGKHRPNGYINVVGRRCQFPLGCRKFPSYGPPETMRALMCADHKLEGHVSISYNMCQHPGCGSHANFGIKGTKTVLYCGTHKDPTLHVNVRSKKCAEPGCDSIPSYTAPGSTKMTHCGKHAGCVEDGWKNRRMKHCIGTNCNRTAVYGPKYGRLVHCPEHRVHGDAPSVFCTADNCFKEASYGELFAKRKTRCKTHKTKRHFTNNHPLCVIDGCWERAIFAGYYWPEFPIHCDVHKESRDINIIEAKCQRCGLMQHLRADSSLCNDCHGFDAVVIVRQARKEIVIKRIIQAAGIDMTHNRVPAGSCLKYRPDFVVDYGYLILIIEVDEDQHRTYPCECEQMRMFNIAQDFGGIPVVFIRYNPDKYKNNVGKQGTPSTDRLVDVIKSFGPDRFQVSETYLRADRFLLQVMYLFYDGDDGTNPLFIISLDDRGNIRQARA